MIKKVINSYDIHVGGQQLRIVNGSEVSGRTGGFDNLDLLLNEPRGSKYLNLLIYESAAETLKVDVYSNSILDNKDILLKSFIRSLLDRGHINEQKAYIIKEKDVTHTYEHDDLGQQNIHEVSKMDGFYCVNDKKVAVEKVDFELSIENITELKEYVKEKADFEGYLVVMNKDIHAVINEEKTIVAYPVAEAVSVLNKIYGQKEIIALTAGSVKIEKNKFSFQYYLISNSQFYIDDTDIYKEGFVIK